jgi:hypothetical protein
MVEHDMEKVAGQLIIQACLVGFRQLLCRKGEAKINKDSSLILIPRGVTKLWNFRLLSFISQLRSVSGGFITRG